MKKKRKSLKIVGGAPDVNESAASNNELNRNLINTDVFKAEDFLRANKKVSKLSLNFLKDIYDLTKSNENATSSLDNPLSLETEQLKTPVISQLKKKKRKQKGISISKTEAPVSSLIVDDFDEDQIWEELELQNRLMYDNLVSSVSKLLAYKDKTLGTDKRESSDEISVSEEEEGKEINDEPLRNDEEEDEDSDFFESDEKYAKKKRKQQANQLQYKRSIVDDKFFSLAQMTEHIEQVEAEIERAEAKKSNQNKENDDDGSSSSDDDSIDLFEDVPSESDADDEDKEEPTKYFYKDFFDPPTISEQEPNETKESEIIEKDVDDTEEGELFGKKSVAFEGDEADEDDENDKTNIFGEDDGDESDQDTLGLGRLNDDGDEKVNEKLGKQVNETLSTFEKKQRKIEENIEDMENKALEPKSWHLLGESAAENRPENALLEEHLIYDHLIRPAPEITVETTLKLEDVIKQRIKDGAFDDVQRKVRPVEDPREYKKRLVLDAEKSKSSLAEIYEKEYLDQKQVEDGINSDDKEPEEHVQIKKEMKSLFQKLDALSHFHFTPKTPTAEIKIISNTPSMSVEETAATSISDANMLAPQEIQDHTKGAIKGLDERSSTDKKRERRKKKKKQHLNRLASEEKARRNGLDLKNIKLAEGIVKSQKSKDIAHDSYSTSQQSGKELKSSKAFFAKLQEGANAHIDKVAKRKLNPSISKNHSSKLSAKKFKL